MTDRIKTICPPIFDLGHENIQYLQECRLHLGIGTSRHFPILSLSGRNTPLTRTMLSIANFHKNTRQAVSDSEHHRTSHGENL
jgi:hypothetical protein